MSDDSQAKNKLESLCKNMSSIPFDVFTHNVQFHPDALGNESLELIDSVSTTTETSESVCPSLNVLCKRPQTVQTPLLSVEEALLPSWHIAASPSSTFLAILQDSKLWIRGLTKALSQFQCYSTELPQDPVPGLRRICWSLCSKQIAVMLPSTRSVLIFAILNESIQLRHKFTVPVLDDAPMSILTSIAFAQSPPCKSSGSKSGSTYSGCPELLIVDERGDMFRTHLPLHATSHSVQVESKHKTITTGNPYANSNQLPSSFDKSFAEFQNNSVDEPTSDDASKNTESSSTFEFVRCSLSSHHTLVSTVSFCPITGLLAAAEPQRTAEPATDLNVPPKHDVRVTLWKLLPQSPFIEFITESSPHVPPPTSLTFSQRLGLSLSASLSTLDRLGIKLLFSPDGTKLACLNLHGHLTIFTSSELSIVYRSPVLDLHYPPIQFNIPAAPYNLIDLPAVHGERAELNPNGTWLSPAGDGISDFGWWSNDVMIQTRRDAQLQLITLSSVSSDSSALQTTVSASLSFSGPILCTSGTPLNARCLVIEIRHQYFRNKRVWTESQTAEQNNRPMRRRTVSVMSIAKPTPFDYYQQRIEARDYETALSCAKQFKIRPDAVYEKQWLDASVNELSIWPYLHSLHSLASSHNDFNLWVFVLDQCRRVCHDVNLTRYLLVYGLCATKLASSEQILTQSQVSEALESDHSVFFANFFSNETNPIDLSDKITVYKLVYRFWFWQTLNRLHTFEQLVRIATSHRHHVTHLPGWTGTIFSGFDGNSFAVFRDKDHSQILSDLSILCAELLSASQSSLAVDIFSTYFSLHQVELSSDQVLKAITETFCGVINAAFESDSGVWSLLPCCEDSNVNMHWLDFFPQLRVNQSSAFSSSVISRLSSVSIEELVPIATNVEEQQQHTKQQLQTRHRSDSIAKKSLPNSSKSKNRAELAAFKAQQLPLTAIALQSMIKSTSATVSAAAVCQWYLSSVLLIDSSSGQLDLAIQFGELALSKLPIALCQHVCNGFSLQSLISSAQQFSRLVYSSTSDDMSSIRLQQWLTLPPLTRIHVIVFGSVKPSAQLLNSTTFSVFCDKMTESGILTRESDNHDSSKMSFELTSMLTKFCSQSGLLDSLLSINSKVSSILAAYLLDLCQLGGLSLVIQLLGAFRTPIFDPDNQKNELICRVMLVSRLMYFPVGLESNSNFEQNLDLSHSFETDVLELFVVCTQSLQLQASKSPVSTLLNTMFQHAYHAHQLSVRGIDNSASKLLLLQIQKGSNIVPLFEQISKRSIRFQRNNITELGLVAVARDVAKTLSDTQSLLLGQSGDEVQWIQLLVYLLSLRADLFASQISIDELLCVFLHAVLLSSRFELARKLLNGDASLSNAIEQASQSNKLKFISLRPLRRTSIQVLLQVIREHFNSAPRVVHENMEHASQCLLLAQEIVKFEGESDDLIESQIQIELQTEQKLIEGVKSLHQKMQQCLDAEPAKAEGSAWLSAWTDVMQQFDDDSHSNSSISNEERLNLVPLSIRMSADRLVYIANWLCVDSHAVDNPDEVLELAELLNRTLTHKQRCDIRMMIARRAIELGRVSIARSQIKQLMHDEYRPAWHACLQLATLPSEYFQGEEGISVEDDIFDPDTEKADALGHALSVCPAEKLDSVLNAWRNLKASAELKQFSSHLVELPEIQNHLQLNARNSLIGEYSESQPSNSEVVSCLSSFQYSDFNSQLFNVSSNERVDALRTYIDSFFDNKTDAKSDDWSGSLVALNLIADQRDSSDELMLNCAQNFISTNESFSLSALNCVSDFRVVCTFIQSQLQPEVHKQQWANTGIRYVGARILKQNLDHLSIDQCIAQVQPCIEDDATDKLLKSLFLSSMEALRATQDVTSVQLLLSSEIDVEQFNRSAEYRSEQLLKLACVPDQTALQTAMSLAVRYHAPSKFELYSFRCINALKTWPDIPAIQRASGEAHSELMKHATEFDSQLVQCLPALSGTDLPRLHFFYRLRAECLRNTALLSPTNAMHQTVRVIELNLQVLERLQTAGLNFDYHRLLSVDRSTALAELRSKLNDSNVAVLARLASRLEDLRPISESSKPLFTSSRVYAEHAVRLIDQSASSISVPFLRAQLVPLFNRVNAHDIVESLLWYCGASPHSDYSRVRATKSVQSPWSTQTQSTSHVPLLVLSLFDHDCEKLPAASVRATVLQFGVDFLLRRSKQYEQDRNKPDQQSLVHVPADGDAASVVGNAGHRHILHEVCLVLNAASRMADLIEQHMIQYSDSETTWIFATLAPIAASFRTMAPDWSVLRGLLCTLLVDGVPRTDVQPKLEELLALSIPNSDQTGSKKSASLENRIAMMDLLFAVLKQEQSESQIDTSDDVSDFLSMSSNLFDQRSKQDRWSVQSLLSTCSSASASFLHKYFANVGSIQVDHWTKGWINIKDTLPALQHQTCLPPPLVIPSFVSFFTQSNCAVTDNAFSNDTHSTEQRILFRYLCQAPLQISSESSFPTLNSQLWFSSSKSLEFLLPPSVMVSCFGAAFPVDWTSTSRQWPVHRLDLWPLHVHFALRCTISCALQAVASSSAIDSLKLLIDVAVKPSLNSDPLRIALQSALIHLSSSQVKNAGAISKALKDLSLSSLIRQNAIALCCNFIASLSSAPTLSLPRSSESTDAWIRNVLSLVMKTLESSDVTLQLDNVRFTARFLDACHRASWFNIPSSTSTASKSKPKSSKPKDGWDDDFSFDDNADDSDEADEDESLQVPSWAVDIWQRLLALLSKSGSHSADFDSCYLDVISLAIPRMTAVVQREWLNQTLSGAQSTTSVCVGMQLYLHGCDDSIRDTALDEFVLPALIAANEERALKIRSQQSPSSQQSSLFSTHTAVNLSDSRLLDLVLACELLTRFVPGDSEARIVYRHHLPAVSPLFAACLSHLLTRSHAFAIPSPFGALRDDAMTSITQRFLGSMNHALCTLAGDNYCAFANTLFDAWQSGSKDCDDCEVIDNQDERLSEPLLVFLRRRAQQLQDVECYERDLCLQAIESQDN